MKRALIAMSGGVDSSVAAYLTKEAGYECIGATMKLYQNADLVLNDRHTCCSLDDVADARAIANSMGIDHYVFNFSDRFRECVMDKFVQAYEEGITPNPCIECNRHLKFEYLMHRAKELDLDYVVTGHYVQIERDENSGRYLLKKAVDTTKDQSYVLYSMTQEQLAHTLFPLGGMTKDQTRAIAQMQGFINAKKHDSQDICFVPDGNYVAFIEQHSKKQYPEGDFVDIKGNVLGRHKGIIRYTIGQRRGLGLSLKESMYVKEIDVKNNRVILALDADLYSTTLLAKEVNWISIEDLKQPMRVKAKVRYRHKEDWAMIYPHEEGIVKVVFEQPQRAITKGQAVVFYDGDYVVGGGTICETKEGQAWEI